MQATLDFLLRSKPLDFILIDVETSILDGVATAMLLADNDTHDLNFDLMTRRAASSIGSQRLRIELSPITWMSKLPIAIMVNLPWRATKTLQFQAMKQTLF